MCAYTRHVSSFVMLRRIYSDFARLLGDWLSRDATSKAGRINGFAYICIWSRLAPSSPLRLCLFRREREREGVEIGVNGFFC